MLAAPFLIAKITNEQQIAVSDNRGDPNGLFRLSCLNKRTMRNSAFLLPSMG